MWFYGCAEDGRRALRQCRSPDGKGEERMERSLGLVIVAILWASLTACLPGAEQGSHRTSEDVKHETLHRQTTVTMERTGAPTLLEESSARQEATAVTDTPVFWDYVALGDSLAVGVGAHKGYVDRYAAYITNDTGAQINLVNLGRSGQTSSELLHVLRNDPAMRRALGTAEVITFNIGINDLGHAGQAYENVTCGGSDNQECLRAAVEAFKANWDAIIAELLSLRSTEDTVIRTAGIGYTPRVDAIFEPYVDEVNHHIATTAANHDIPYAQPYLDDRYISSDGIHPNDDGYEAIADGLRELGFGPLNSPR
jgi:lysophospholipase L1-like esterase